MKTRDEIIQLAKDKNCSVAMATGVVFYPIKVANGDMAVKEVDFAGNFYVAEISSRLTPAEPPLDDSGPSYFPVYSKRDTNIILTLVETVELTVKQPVVNLTIEEIERKLGYKIQIVNSRKEKT